MTSSSFPDSSTTSHGLCSCRFVTHRLPTAPTALPTDRTRVLRASGVVCCLALTPRVVCVCVRVCTSQDGASAHRAKATSKWFAERVGMIDLIKNWPANSPDLNPIENLWAIVSGKLANQAWASREALKVSVDAAWAAISPETIHNLVMSFKSRCEACLAAKGQKLKR